MPHLKCGKKLHTTFQYYCTVRLCVQYVLVDLLLLGHFLFSALKIIYIYLLITHICIYNLITFIKIQCPRRICFTLTEGFSV